MLFKIRYDGHDYFVEAENMKDAIDVWHEHLRTLPPDDGWSGDEWPEEAIAIHDEPVIRRTVRNATFAADANERS